MDPDEALKRIRALYDADHDSYTAEELIDLIQGLDEWLSRGRLSTEGMDRDG